MTVAELQKDQEFSPLHPCRGQHSIFKFVGRVSFDQVLDTIRAIDQNNGISEGTGETFLRLINALPEDEDYYEAVWVSDAQGLCPSGSQSHFLGSTEVELIGRG